MRSPALHYAGPLTWKWGKNGVANNVGTTAVCDAPRPRKWPGEGGSGRTRVRADVTCKRCLAILVRADQWEREHAKKKPCAACDGRGTTEAQPGGQGDWSSAFCPRCGGTGEAKSQ